MTDVKTDQVAFLSKFRISERTFEDSGLSWHDLLLIREDYNSRREKLSDTLDLVLKRISRIPGVHSTRGRLKDAEHLMEKCIRKRIKYPDLSVGNYTKYVTDLIGVRALHLYKNQWIDIHQCLRSEWEIIGDAVAYARVGDDCSLYNNHKCAVVYRDPGYRSVHYNVRANILDVQAEVEVQVRTLFEEAWSEIDHHVRYPYGGDPAVADFLVLFNRMAGAADEMAGYVGRLRDHIDRIEQTAHAELRQRDSEIQALRNEVGHLKTVTDKERKMLTDRIDLLSKSVIATNVGSAVGVLVGSFFGGLERAGALQRHSTTSEAGIGVRVVDNSSEAEGGKEKKAEDPDPTLHSRRKPKK